MARTTGFDMTDVQLPGLAVEVWKSCVYPLRCCPKIDGHIVRTVAGRVYGIEMNYWYASTCYGEIKFA